MESNLEIREDGVPDATPKRSRVKAAVAAVVVAGALSAWGVASVFAASPTPSASATHPTGTHACPAHATTSGSTN
jgi:hypothetical protein